MKILFYWYDLSAEYWHLKYWRYYLKYYSLKRYIKKSWHETFIQKFVHHSQTSTVRNDPILEDIEYM